jgi:hypothetical protein
MSTRERALSMQEDFALKRAEREGFLIDPSYRQVLWPWWLQSCHKTHQPFIAGCPKQRYAVLEINLDPCYPREFTEAGNETLVALMREHSRGTKHWSASGGRHHWLCIRIPVEHIEALAREIRQHIDEWTIVPDLAASIW